MVPVLLFQKNITLKNSDNNITGRNAVSCTGCDTVTVTNNTFNNIGYQGIDVEIEAAKWYGRNISITNNTFGAVQLSNFSASGFGLDTTNLTFANNKATASVKTCQPAVYLDSSTARNNVKITGNSLLAIGTAVSISRATDVTIQDNTVKITNGSCTGGVRGVYAANVNGGTLRGNDFSTSAMPLQLFAVQQPVANVIACGNRVPGSSLFDKPAVCPTGGPTIPLPPTSTPSQTVNGSPLPPSTPAASPSSSGIVSTPSGRPVVSAQGRQEVRQGQLVAIDTSNITDQVKVRQIIRVEYYDGAKLLQTVAVPLFALNTQPLKPGYYRINERTYYLDGTTSEQSKNITIKPASAVTPSKYSGLGGVAAISAILLTGLLVIIRSIRMRQASKGPFGSVFQGGMQEQEHPQAVIMSEHDKDNNS